MNKDDINKIIDTGNYETRSINFSEFRVADDDGGDGATISGYAAVFETESDSLPWSEVFVRGCFDNADMTQCKALFNHNEEIVLGSVSGNSLKLSIESRGLYYENKCPKNDYVDNVVLSPMRRGDIDKSSIRFRVSEDEWIYDEGADTYRRRIIQVSHVLDVSPVTFPAYSAATSSLRKASDLVNIDVVNKQAQIESEQSARESELRKFY